MKLILEAYDRKLMENRAKKIYRHKGLREISVNTVIGEIKYKRLMYEIEENVKVNKQYRANRKETEENKEI